MLGAAGNPAVKFGPGSTYCSSIFFWLRGSRHAATCFESGLSLSADIEGFLTELLNPIIVPRLAIHVPSLTFYGTPVGVASKTLARISRN